MESRRGHWTLWLLAAGSLCLVGCRTPTGSEESSSWFNFSSRRGGQGRSSGGGAQPDGQPRPTAILRRGNFLDRGETVDPGTPASLHRAATDAPRDRLGLARWLVDRENPLVARVTVNRWWAEFFGRGIVGTPEDFGVKGEPPTHPELLDWLAVEFMEHGWSTKHIHRLIALSAT